MSLLAALIEASGRYRSHPLHVATNARSVLLLYTVGRADIEARNIKGDTPLIRASRAKSDVVEALLALGADPNARNDDTWFPLIGAVMLIDADADAIVTALLEAGADANARWAARGREMSGYTALLLLLDTTSNGDLCVRRARLLLEWGADPTISSTSGRTAADTLQGRPRWNRFSRPLDQVHLDELSSLLVAH